jgi:hypothetical protein
MYQRAVRISPSSVDTGGLQSNDWHVDPISTVRESQSRSMREPVPVIAPAALSRVAGTGTSLAGRPMAAAIRLISSGVDSSTPSDARNTPELTAGISTMRAISAHRFHTFSMLRALTIDLNGSGTPL